MTHMARLVKRLQPIPRVSYHCQLRVLQRAEQLAALMCLHQLRLEPIEYQTDVKVIRRILEDPRLSKV